MNMQQRTFQSRVNRREEAARLEQKVRFAIETRDDLTNEVLFTESYTFTKPDEGRLFLMATAFGSAARPENAASEVDATLRAMLLDRAPIPKDSRRKQGIEEYLLLRERIDGPVEKRVPIEDIMELIGELTEIWAEGFPTQPSSDSPEDSQQTGGRSTGRVHSQESTSSTSPSPEVWPPSTDG
jgi:hypothetical protein